MLDESECKNSGGWFKDPFTGEDIGPDYPRAVTCKSGDKWVQPAVCFQNGNIVKISGRCWNDDERACYKEYRGKPAGTTRERKPREPKPVKPKVEHAVSEQVEEQEREVIKYDLESAASVETLKILAECDCIIGVSKIADLTYALVTKNGSKTVHHIPRACIPDAEFERLCCGDEY